ncbi:MAG: class I SAM-dependent methyltransferase [bacterium]|nr:class I SAM-dependent methyltransferase [bacterium]
MGFYERRIFPHILDAAMRGMNDLRAETLALARGDVLEIGFGTGLNLKYYPDTVGSLSALDPMDALEEVVEKRIEAAGFPVERHALPADRHLPYDDARFDTVAVTWTLCTIPDPVAALLEMRRVLKPEGQMLFVEHGRSDDDAVARWQDRLNPIQKVIGCGCNLNRAIDAVIEKSGFRLQHLERFEREKTPRILGSMYRGVAGH